ncbi:MAG: hypothetical protein KatS3mg076_1983 [Candidatus Binatia bacterium]|nr:MAG: hypothetical protein KatS3mg076_1983 [Candidatus Binatia bacterium]
MQYLVLAHDGTDPEAPARRQAAREAHLEKARELKARGRLLFGAALLDEEGRMVGSAVLVDFPTREELDRWLASDPYVKGGVWRTIQVTPCKVTV